MSLRNEGQYCSYYDNMPAVFINRDLLQLSMLASDVTRPLRTKQLLPVSDVTHVTVRHGTSRLEHLLNNTLPIWLMSDSGDRIKWQWVVNRLGALSRRGGFYWRGCRCGQSDHAGESNVVEPYQPVLSHSIQVAVEIQMGANMGMMILDLAEIRYGNITQTGIHLTLINLDIFIDSK